VPPEWLLEKTVGLLLLLLLLLLRWRYWLP
jgi:hypothetical protein